MKFGTLKVHIKAYHMVAKFVPISP